MSSLLPGALRSVQRLIEELYALEPGPDVVEFVSVGTRGQREQLLVRQQADAVEIGLRFPPCLMRDPLPSAWPEPSDTWLQVIEGVSHFVHLVQRARADLPTTLLELELQAEVDKFVLLALAHRRQTHHFGSRARAVRLQRVLFENVRFLHPPGTTRGERYRVANSLAARYVKRLLELSSVDAVLEALRRFCRSGQSEKVWLATLA